jgi:hypothetical protein
MSTQQQRELDREQWRDLVRGLCLVQAGGYPGAVSISKRFLQSPAEEVDLMAHLARHMVQEYGLTAELEVDGNRVLIRIDKADESVLDEKPQPDLVGASDATLSEGQSSPILRLLHLVHLPIRA